MLSHITINFFKINFIKSLKYIVVFLTVVALFTKCQTEELLVEHHEEHHEVHFNASDFNMTVLQKEEYLKNDVLNKTFAHIEEQLSGDCGSTKSGDIYSEVHNFYINTEKATFIENADKTYHSYTFQITRPNSDGPLENLFFSLQPDGTYKTTLVSYNLTEEEKLYYFLGNDIDFAGKVSSREIEGGDLTSLLLKQATLNCIWVIRTWCAGDNHVDGYINGTECPAHRSDIEVYCIGGAGSSEGSTGGGSTSDPGEGGGTTDPNTGSGGSGGGSGGTSGGSIEDDVTTPTCVDCISLELSTLLNELGIFKLGEAIFELPDPNLIDLQTFLIEGELVACDMSGGFMYICKGAYIYCRNGQYQFYNHELGEWQLAYLATTSLSNELTSLIGRSAVEGAQLVASNLLPIEDFYILFTGEDFDGLASSQYAAGAFLLLEVIPGTKLLKPVANVLGDATKYFFKYGDDLLDLVKVGNVVKFTDKTVLELAEKATKKSTKPKVMLGKFGEGGIFYSTEAENFDCCYYSLDYWSDVKDMVGGDKSQMWEINKQFLLNNKGKTFYMCHNPEFATDFFKEEIDLIKKWDGFLRFEKEGNYWKAIFD